MNASGGATAPLNDASEQFSVSEPKTSSSNNNDTGTTSSNSNRSQQQTSGSTTQSSSSHEQRDPSLQDRAARQKQMNEEDLQHAGVSHAVTGDNAGVDDVKRSSQRAPKDVGAQDDVEMLHGKTTLEGNDRSEEGKSGVGGKEGKTSSGGTGVEKSEFDEDMRHKAAKFVNVEE